MPQDIFRRNAERVVREWVGTARHAQFPLWQRDKDAPRGWLVVGGRGAGKTRLGAEWVNGLVKGFDPFVPDGPVEDAGTGRRRRYRAIALVGETLADVREVMIDGPSGIRTVARGVPPRFEATRRRLVWEDGAVAHAFSSEDPESLRGPQFDAAWCDELGKWKHAEATFDMLQFSLRLGPAPRLLVTTTPRPTALVRRLMADPALYLTRMATADNAQNLAPGFIEAMERRYGRTRLGRQELQGELIVDREDALWTRAMAEDASARPPRGSPGRIVVAVDPPASSGRRSDACGIVAAAREGEDGAVVLEDWTVSRARPQEWAARAVALYRRLEADLVLAEVNQGGEMVAAVIRGVDAAVPVKAARAVRGKWLRAEPVAALYEQGRIRHARRFPELEDEMCDFGPDGLSGGRSPDRLDALVWALTELLLGQAAAPRVRRFF